MGWDKCLYGMFFQHSVFYPVNAGSGNYDIQTPFVEETVLKKW